MPKRGRSICALYATTCLWLAYCAVQSARNDFKCSAVLFILAAAVCLIGGARETQVPQQLRGADVRSEEAAWPCCSVDGARTTLATACCELWWTSAGADHEDGCRNPT